MNLVDITGRLRANEGPDEYWPERVLDIELVEAGLAFREQCDDCFRLILNANDVTRLIDWLTAVRKEMT